MIRFTNSNRKSKMKYPVNTIYLLIGIFLFASSCKVSKSLPANYFNNQKKVGLILVKDSISMTKTGSQGLIDMALTPGKRFTKPLLSVAKMLDFEDDLKKVYIDAFNVRNKELKEENFNLNLNDIGDYPKRKSPQNKVKYYPQDLRILKRDNLDELLIVRVKYGLLNTYSGFIEIMKEGYCKIEVFIVDLETNEVVYRGSSEGKERLKGEWKLPPEYSKLRHSIESAILKAAQKEKSKFGLHKQH